MLITNNKLICLCLFISLFGSSPKVTGRWAQAKQKWAVRLQYMHDEKHRDLVLREIEKGVQLPFDKAPKRRIWAASNHRDLCKRPKQVCEALDIQLKEGSIEGYDMSSKDRQPKAVLALRWVEKSDPTKVRLTLNGRPLNKYFPKAVTTIVLETHRELRTRYKPRQKFVGFDLHNGFFNHMYDERFKPWVCFRIHQTEMMPTHEKKWRRRLPTSWVDGYCYFCYRGLVMGLSPSCQQITRVMDAIVGAWKRCQVRDTDWDASNYIDDLVAFVDGTFEGALEVGQRLLTEYVILGFAVNVLTIIKPKYYTINLIDNI